jgi:signal transduction histidine kinase
MIQDMLDYQQIRKGKFRKNIQKFNLIDTIEKAMTIQRFQAQEKNL